MGYYEIIRPGITHEKCDKCDTWQWKHLGRLVDDKYWFCQECK